MSSPSHSVAWKYNQRGQVIEASHTVAGVSRVFAWTHDSADRQRTLTYPAIGANPAEQVTTTYDAGWRPNSLCTGSNCYVQSGAKWTALGQPDSWLFGDSLERDWSYDPQMQRLQRMAVRRYGLPTHYDRTYSYDAVGNVETITNHRSGRTDHYSYDHRDRLVHAWTYLTTGGQPAPLAMPMQGVASGTTEASLGATAEELSPTAAALGAPSASELALLPDAAAPAQQRRARRFTPNAPGGLPLVFVPNTGQLDEQVRYVSPALGRTLFFTDKGVVMSLGVRERLPAQGNGQGLGAGGRRDGVAVTTLRYTGADMKKLAGTGRQSAATARGSRLTT